MVMNNLPGIYSIDIQQGNIINQDMINQLRPKMTKRQVLYIMGSSMLMDVFHQKRWDYLYSIQPGGEARKQKRLSLFFQGDELIGVQGDFKPSTLAVVRPSNETTVDVPKRELDQTIWGKMKRMLSEEGATESVVLPDPRQPASDDTVTTTAEDPETPEAQMIPLEKDPLPAVQITPLQEDQPQFPGEVINDGVSSPATVDEHADIEIPEAQATADASPATTSETALQTQQDTELAEQ